MTETQEPTIPTDAAPKVKRKRRRLYQAEPEEPIQTQPIEPEVSPELGPGQTDTQAAHQGQKAAVPVAEQQTLAVQRQCRHLAGRNVIKNHVVATMSLALVPVPVFDVLVISGALVELVEKLADLYDVPGNHMRFKTLVAALVGGLGSYWLSSLSLYSFSKVIPGWRWFAAGAAMPLTAGAVTYAVGSVLLQHFEAGGTLDERAVPQLQAQYRQQVKKGYTLAQQWSRTASTPS